jgi:cytoskeletal protein RodZ
MRRRAGRRQQEQAPATPGDIGAALRDAREGSAVTLAEVQDRTGVPWQHLEALEAGELARIPDERSALTAVRRYSDLMSLDAEQFSRVVEEHWGNPSAGFPSPAVAAPTGRGRKGGRHRSGAPAVAAVPVAGHLSHYPDDGTHLRAFTQTAQVPGVRRSDFPVGTATGTHGAFSVTGSFPASPGWYPEVRPAPLLLQAAVWLTATLVVVALAIVAVHHYAPQWLIDIHLVRTNGTSPPPTTPTATGTGRVGSHTHGSGALVTQTSIGNGSAAISVRATNYSVEVAATGACWVSASTPQSFSPVFEQTLQSGQTHVINSANGQLTVNLGSSFALLAVQINGKAVGGWLFKPPSAPFVLNFTSSSP